MRVQRSRTTRQTGEARKRGRVGRPALAVTAALALTAAAGTAGAVGASHHPLGSHTAGAQPDGSFLTQTGQYVTPVGDVIKYNGRPFGLALSPDGRTAAALNNGGATTGLVAVYDLVNHTVLQQTGSGGKSNGGIAYSPDGRSLWAARPDDLQRFPVLPNGTLGAPVTVKLPGKDGRSPVPAGLAFAPDGSLLVTLSANNTLGVVDPATNALVKEVGVGNVPTGVAVVGGKAYVSNQGGRPALASDRTDSSYGTPIVTNNNSAVPSTGTLSEVDLGRGTQSRTYNVGRGPSAVLAVGRNVVVANSDDDTVTSIDTAKGRVGRTFVTNPAPGDSFGASPNGLTMIDRDHLAVSLGRDNAVAVYTYQNSNAQPSFEGLIPAGSYPTGIAQDKQLGKLVIASEQGIGAAVGPPGTIKEGINTTPATSHLGYNFVGTVQTVGVPNPDQMKTYTQQVFKNNNWNGLLLRNQPGNRKAVPVALPARAGDPSKIKHVFMIVKENRTYDQVFGDDPRGNGDPTLAQFGQRVTPNTHALAKQFPLIDNLYSDGTNSAEGHHWLDQAFVNNYMQQMYGSYTRSYQTGDPMSNVKTGWIWENVLRHKLSANNWGEQIDSYTDANGKGTPNDWEGWLHDSKVLDGTAPGPLKYPLGTYTAKTDIPSLAQITKPNFPNFDLNIPDQYRAAMFGNDFNDYVKKNNLPAFNMAWIMSDHTNGTSPGKVSPEAYVADNDLAVGRMVDQISHSKYWKDSAIFVVEDDSQNGVDHVDGHRAPVQVISPYAKRNAVVNTYYSQLNMMRTIEQILGLPPMNQQDLTAEPMYDVFTDKPNFAPFTHQPNQVPLTERNPATSAPAPTPTLAPTAPPAAAAAPASTPKASALTAQAAWADWSSKQDWSTEDTVNMAQGNRDIWYSSNGFTRAYPGDPGVLLPEQVPGAGTPSRGKIAG